MCTLMLCGSPHGEGGNSTLILEALKERLGGRAEIYNALQSPEKAEAEFVSAVKSGRNIVFSFPLYADSLPAYFIGFLRRLEKAAAGIKSQSRVYVIVNNGFYDSFQNIIAVKMMWKWCDECALTRGRALAVGAGGMAQAAPVGKGPLARLAGALDILSEDIKKGSSGELLSVKPSFPRLIYKAAGNMSFSMMGKKNGLKKRDIKK